MNECVTLGEDPFDNATQERSFDFVITSSGTKDRGIEDNVRSRKAACSEIARLSGVQLTGML